MLCPPLFQMIEKFVNFCKQKDFLHCANFDDEVVQLVMFQILCIFSDFYGDGGRNWRRAWGGCWGAEGNGRHLWVGGRCCVSGLWHGAGHCVARVLRIDADGDRKVLCQSAPITRQRAVWAQKLQSKICVSKWSQNSCLIILNFSKLERKLETGKVRVTVSANGIFTDYRIARYGKIAFQIQISIVSGDRQRQTPIHGHGTQLSHCEVHSRKKGPTTLAQIGRGEEKAGGGEENGSTITPIIEPIFHILITFLFIFLPFNNKEFEL